LEAITNNANFAWAAALIFSFIITYVSIPSIVQVARMKNLYNVPDERTVHTNLIPTLGGLAMFAGFTISISLFIPIQHFHVFGYIVASIVVIFFVGIKDDILIIAPVTKLIGEVFSASIFIFFADIRITNLHGFSGIEELPYWASILTTFFVYLVIVNAMNFIDGIDGLASGIGIVVVLSFGIYFHTAGTISLSVLSAGMIGALLAFFRFNVYGGANKIFMGDTGSLLLGTVISILVIYFNEININPDSKYFVHSAPSVAFGVLAIPLFDMLRVVLIRIGLGRSPTKPDRNHIHHKLLRLGFSHAKSTAILICFSIFFSIFSFYFQFVSIRRLLLLILVMAMFLSYLPDIIYSRRKRDYTKP